MPVPTIINDSASAGPPTVLGQAHARIPIGGKIRAGIKVLTAKAAAQPRAQSLYEQGVAAGQSFDQIEHAITEALPQLKNPLAPRNVAWFTVRPQDFPNPAIARQILDAYAEDRGEGRRLYRFPVVFPSDRWQTVMPHELAAWSTHEKRYWSEYSPDGRVRHCMTHAPVPMDDTGRRTIRIFGGRKTMARETNGGLCEPERCPEYQHRQCNLSGRFLFFIPGIRSISAFELHTNSFYAMNGAIQKFETVSFLRGGRISGFLDRQHATFFLTKKLMEVAHIDEQGKPVRMPQWIIELEAPVDVTALLREREDEDAALRQAQLATQLLGGEAPGSVAASAPATGGLPGPEPAPDDGAPSLQQLLAQAEARGIDPVRYQAYAARRWGAGWKLNRHGRRQAWNEMAERYRHDPEGYRDKIESELALADGSAA
ncbi:hypothetical protein [Sphaerotilus sp.]|uniref:recombination directionality factor n=1 Tax=Sphaerotilus sp. TaxID=2093942 RepID=UPI002ACDC352|nr:hypothetical protein [Sphaerotilus sp.]MDZ7855788.1 hypothetical protein [Sphaerotilus sp.]